MLIDCVLKKIFPEDKFPEGNDAWDATQDTALAWEKMNSCCVAYIGGGNALLLFDSAKEGENYFAIVHGDGNIYNYESIDAGQIFGGEILGDEKILRKLIAYVGRSRFTQYGKCLVTFGDVEKVPAQIFPDKIFSNWKRR